MQDLASYLNPALGIYSEQDVLDIIHFQSGVARMDGCARLRQEIDGQIVPYYLPNAPDSSDPTNISQWIEKITVNNNTAQDVHRDADFTIREIPSIKQFNTPKDLIQMYMQYFNELDEVLLDVPVGIFRFSIPDRLLKDDGNIWTIKGYDLTSKIASLFFMDTYTIPANYPITDAIRVMLMADYLPPSQGGRFPYGMTSTSGTGSAGTGNLTDFSATQRSGSFPGNEPGVNGILLATGNMVGIPGGIVHYYEDSTTPRGYARALYSGPVPGGDPSWNFTDGVGNVSDVIMCAAQGNSGSGAGYCPTGYAVIDPRSGCVGTRNFANVLHYTHPQTAVEYNPNIGTKIDPSTGCPIDPVSCGPMQYVEITDIDGLHRFYFKTADGGYFFNQLDGDFTTQSPFFPNQIAYDPKTGESIGRGADPLNKFGGDGGVSQGTGVGCPFIEAGAAWNIDGVWVPGFAPDEINEWGTFVPLGAGYSILPPVTSVGWPDPNNPGLTPAGCDNIGPNIPFERIQIVHSDLTSPSPIPFNRGTNMLAAINTLLAAINYYPLWVDESGVFRSSPIPYYADLIPDATWKFRTDSTSIFRPEGISARLADQTQLANVIQVISEKNSAVPIVSVAYNTSVNSAISITNLGYAILRVVQDDTIVTQDVADLRAFIELQFAALQSEGLDFGTAPNPFTQTHETYDINVTTKEGVPEITSDNYPFEETAWSLDFDTMVMSHTVGRIVPV